jgi:two-component system sensor histidine kinase KdpD
MPFTFDRQSWPPVDPTLAAYSLALLSSGVALGVSLALAPVGGDDSIPGLLFLGAVGLSGWYGGFGPAALATVCGAIALDYFFETPAFDLNVANPRTVAYLLSFLLVSILLGLFNARLRESNRVLRVERDRAEAAVIARDELIAIVSHDLRTPLTAIKTSMYTLRDPTIALSAETRDRLLSNVEAEADRLVHAVTSALALRSLENGLSPQWERMEPSEVVSAALDRCLPELGARQITFQIPDDLPAMWMDAALLDQALRVLFENVAAHTPSGSPLEIHGGMQNKDLFVSVSDAGPGVPAEARERIFEKYVRLDRSDAGVGLGLAIARAAVEAQRGRLCVADSKLGGACFTILIPQNLERSH